MYTIIPLLLAQIQVLNNQIKYLLIFIAKNIPFKSNPSDWNSPKYNKLKVDKTGTNDFFTNARSQIDQQIILLYGSLDHNSSGNP